MKKGDERLAEIYNYLQQFTAENGYPPSVREIGSHFDIRSTATVQYYLEKLRKNGQISPANKRKRSIVINGKNRVQPNFVPLVGNVSAGQGILAIENREGEFPLPQSLFSGNELYLLRVEGDSMIKVGINDGDYVVVHMQNNVEIGEIGVVLWQDKATIKRLKETSPSLVLHPENDTMEDIVISPAENPFVIGKVVGCIKRF